MIVCRFLLVRITFSSVISHSLVSFPRVSKSSSYHILKYGLKNHGSPLEKIFVTNNSRSLQFILEGTEQPEVADGKIG
jgi:hypothetical protein